MALALSAADARDWVTARDAVGLVGFVILSVGMIPAALYAGRVDNIPLPKPAGDDIGNATAAKIGRAHV